MHGKKKCNKPKSQCKCGCKGKAPKKYRSDTIQKRQPPKKNPIKYF